MRRVYSTLILFILIFSFLWYGTPSFAQEKQKTDSTLNNWNFRISPFFWYIGFKGTIYKPPYPVHQPEPAPAYEIDVEVYDKNRKEQSKKGSGETLKSALHDLMEPQKPIQPISVSIESYNS